MPTHGIGSAMFLGETPAPQPRMLYYAVELLGEPGDAIGAIGLLRIVPQRHFCPAETRLAEQHGQLAIGEGLLRLFKRPAELALLRLKQRAEHSERLGASEERFLRAGPKQ